MHIIMNFRSCALLIILLWIQLASSTDNHDTVKTESILRFQKYKGLSHSLDTFTKGQSLKFKQRYEDEQYWRTLLPPLKPLEHKLERTTSDVGKSDIIHSGDDGSGCTKEMFGGDENAYLACITQYALQTNWFPSPTTSG